MEQKQEKDRVERYDMQADQSEGWNCLEGHLRTAEVEIRLQKDTERAELAELGNYYAKEDIHCVLTGTTTNIEALLPIPCKHTVEIADGRQIPAVSSVTVQKRNGFELHEQICNLCGKTLSLHVRHVRGAEIVEENENGGEFEE